MQALSAESILDRMVHAAQDVRDRMLGVTSALDEAGGPHAAAVWVARVDRAAVRHTQDVDILIRRADLPAAKAAQEKVGFVYRHSAGINMFLDGTGAKARDAVYVVFADEKVRPVYIEPAPDAELPDIAPPFRVLPLESLVRMRLTSFRLKDQVHIQDLIGVGLIDETWPSRLPSALAERLRMLLANPEGW